MRMREYVKVRWLTWAMGLFGTVFAGMLTTIIDCRNTEVPGALLLSGILFGVAASAWLRVNRAQLEMTRLRTLSSTAGFVIGSFFPLAVLIVANGDLLEDLPLGNSVIQISLVGGLLTAGFIWIATDPLRPAIRAKHWFVLIGIPLLCVAVLAWADAVIGAHREQQVRLNRASQRAEEKEELRRMAIRIEQWQVEDLPIRNAWCDRARTTVPHMPFEPSVREFVLDVCSSAKMTVAAYRALLRAEQARDPDDPERINRWVARMIAVENELSPTSQITHKRKRWEETQAKLLGRLLADLARRDDWCTLARASIPSDFDDKRVPEFMEKVCGTKWMTVDAYRAISEYEYPDNPLILHSAFSRVNLASTAGRQGYVHSLQQRQLASEIRQLISVHLQESSPNSR